MTSNQMLQQIYVRRRLPSVYTLHSSSSTPQIKVSVLLEGLLVEMVLDTGAAFSLMAENNF